MIRRDALALILAALASPAAANPGLRPRARPAPPAPAPFEPGLRPVARPTLGGLIRDAGFEGLASVALIDTDGTILATHDAATPRPPASVTKAITALYALDALGEGHRFATRLLATGPVDGGVVQGDLILAGGGDPTLDTDRLAALAAELKAAGVTGARGFAVHAGPIPRIPVIDPDDLPHLAYNPAVSGLNVNFNRLRFTWGGGALRLTAKGETTEVPVSTGLLSVADRGVPVFAHDDGPDADIWTIAAPALREPGWRDLPTRHPELTTGQAFAALAAPMGITLPPPRLTDLAEGTEIALTMSDPLTEIVRGMLAFSTNLTAEVLGLAASQARGHQPATLAESARHMTRWLADTTGARVRLVNHSGLSDQSRIAAVDMAVALASRRLLPLLKTIDVNGDAPGGPDVRAKTGTLDFVSALAGHIAGPRPRTFAIFLSDLDARAAVSPDDEVPPGSVDWNRRARDLQAALLRRWGQGSS